MIDPKWGFRRLTTKSYPIQGAAASASPGQIVIDLKDFAQKETIAQLRIRVFGNIIVAGAGPGVATGRDNPQGLLTQANLVMTPTLGVQTVQNLSARGLNRMNMYDRGYLISESAVPDVASTYAVDFDYLVNFKRGGSIIPAEYSLPMAVYDAALLTLNFGGREQLFTGGTNTWDLSNLQVEFRIFYDLGIAGKFHITEFFERQFQITGSQPDFSLQTVEAGYVYTDIFIRTERNLVLVNDILNNVTIQRGGQTWLPQGDLNALELQQFNRDTRISDPAANLTGLYMISCLEDGMFSNAVDAMDAKLDIRLDVSFVSGTQFVIVGFRRIIPQGIDATGAAATGMA